MALISEEEKNRRRRIVGSVIGTHAMEGIEPDAHVLVLYKRYESGEFTSDQLDRAMEAHANSLVESCGTLAGVA